MLFDRYRQFQGQPSHIESARQFLRDRFDRHESVVFIAIDADGAVGFAQLYPSFSSVSLARVYVLNDLFVHEAARKRGVAARLLAAALQFAWSQGACRVTLNVARTNAAAQTLYESTGWNRDSEFFMYHRRPDEPG